ncbi:MAG TPA: adenylate/guanylate cyclase domain-containing protein [Methylomirabilota bacterium]|jgi:adenylate cyclase|nr:adenylate/guanylate cyclase domain-containing protein [Methylomirabilota bacterium]
MAKARGTRRVSLAIAAGIIIIAGLVYMLAPDFLYVLEFNIYDQHFRIRGARPANPQVAIVAIDEASLTQIGRWPWSRAVLAELVRKIHQAGAASIAFDTLLNEPERSPERAVVDRLMLRLGTQGDPAVRRELQRMIREADPDGALAAAITESGRVVLPINFVLGLGVPVDAPERQGAPMKSALMVFRNYKDRAVAPAPRAQHESFPIPRLLEAAAAVGHVNMMPEIDGSTRYEALVIESRGHYYPSLAVEAVRVAAGLPAQALKITFGESLELGEAVIPIDIRGRVLVDYAGPQGTIPHIPAADILQGKGLDRLKGRIAFVGATAEGLFDLRVTPVTAVLPGVEKHANVAANIIDGRFIVRPKEIELIEAAGIALLPLLLAIVLPSLRPVPSIGLTVLVAGAAFLSAYQAFVRGLWIPIVYPFLALLLTFVAITVYRFLTEERQRMYTRKAFQQYVSPEVVERIMQNPEALAFGGELRNLTVLFSDIRDFTTFTEKNDPHLVVQMLREYLTSMTAIVLEEGGTLDKYIGDAVMAEFGAPIAYPDHALRGCRAALAMTAEVDRLTEKWTSEGKEPFRIGLGVNTGNMVVGNLGSEQLFDYTVIGDEVNLGARLESLNKDYQTTTHIIISEATYEAAKNGIEVRQLGEVKVKGKTRPVVVYELCGLKTTAGR